MYLLLTALNISPTVSNVMNCLLLVDEMEQLKFHATFCPYSS